MTNVNFVIQCECVESVLSAKGLNFLNNIWRRLQVFLVAFSILNCFLFAVFTFVVTATGALLTATAGNFNTVKLAVTALCVMFALGYVTFN